MVNQTRVVDQPRRQWLKSLGTVPSAWQAARQDRKLSVRPKVNSHVHLPPNFSAFASVRQVVDLAVEQDVKVLGVTNYYDYQVYDQFASLSLSAGVFPMFGLEIICLVSDLVKSGVKINDPGNPGRLYICGKGTLGYADMPPQSLAVLETIRRNDRQRMAEMAGKMSTLFAAAGLRQSIDQDYIVRMIQHRCACRPDQVYLQERHIAMAFQEALFAEQADLEARTRLLIRAYGIAPKAPADDAVKTQNEMRANLLRAGKPAFAGENFVDYAQATRMILGMGGIPCYPTLADGASPLCGYEQTPQVLIDNLKSLGLTMAEFIPIRNSPEILGAYVRAMRAAGLTVVGGTEHNTLDLIPLEPACLKGMPVPADVKDIFWEGACVVAAHQFLTAHGEIGFVDADGRPNPAYASAQQRIAAFASLGEWVISKFLETYG